MPRRAPIAWPHGKRFAFTVFDDPDSQSWEAGCEVYALLRDLGFRTTKGVWPLAPTRRASDHGLTCAHPGYVEWIRSLLARGFEVGYHNATSHTSTRAETERGLEQFRSFFGAYPRSMAQHYFCQENLHWGELRLTGAHRCLYNVATRFRNRNRSFGHAPGNTLFWGDLCQERITYVRNFVFADINTLGAWPLFPYHDRARPAVRFWYCASEGSNVRAFCRTARESAQERLEEEGGLCIMYAHFGHGFLQNGRLMPAFRELMERLARRAGWFAPVGEVLDHLRAQRGDIVITDTQRQSLERRWLWHKLFYGTA